MNTYSSRRRAFSRLEAVAVCGTALLSGALLWPVCAQNHLLVGAELARENDLRSRCQSNLKQISLGILQYTQDYDEKFPLTVTTYPTPNEFGYGWAAVIQPYVKSSSILQCPSEKHPAPTPSNPTKPGFSDYWMNSRISGIFSPAINSISQTILLGDGDGGSKSSTARYNIASLPASWRTTPGSPARRHLQWANYAFADGHVKAYPPTRISTKPLAQLPKDGTQVTFSTK